MRRLMMATLAMASAVSVAVAAEVKSLPKRSEVRTEDTWDLTKLFKSDQEWEEAFRRWEGQITEYGKYRGRLAEGAKVLAACLKFDAEFSRAGERLDSYAFLKAAQDQGDSEYQRMKGRLQAAGTKAAEAFSWFAPELMSIPAEEMERMMGAAELAEWKVALERLLRFRPHTLGKGEEQLLAMQGDMSQTAVLAFRQLNDADLKWGLIENEKGELVELGTATWPMFLECPKRSVRREAFVKFYGQYESHKNTLAATLNGAVQKDVYYAKARKYGSALEAALFPDNVPVSVYESLISAVHKRLPALHRYYGLRKRAMKLEEMHIYDTYIPILSEIEKKHSWEEAVKVIVEALKPLGEEYCRELEKGLLTERWADRYPNAGKQSGAFSSGGYDGPPYILMNFQDMVLDHVFTLAHEGGHSMHTYYSARNQPFQYYNYTLFVAEVASTFNEMLLSEYLTKNAKDKRERAYLINRTLDGMRGTIFRQTMFAEFEKITHELVEKGEPLTVETLRREYRKLLEQYFGPAMVIDEPLSLECMRIPHFYRNFYVYKYATGMSAAIALSERVLKGGEKEREDYLNFLKGGSSKFPLDLLRGAGVDMEKPDAVDAALRRFEELVGELEGLL